MASNTNICIVARVALEKERRDGGDSFSESPIGANRVGALFTEPKVKSKKSKTDREDSPRLGRFEVFSGMIDSARVLVRSIMLEAACMKLQVHQKRLVL